MNIRTSCICMYLYCFFRHCLDIIYYICVNVDICYVCFVGGESSHHCKMQYIYTCVCVCVCVITIAYKALMYIYILNVHIISFANVLYVLMDKIIYIYNNLKTARHSTTNNKLYIPDIHYTISCSSICHTIL